MVAVVVVNGMDQQQLWLDVINPTVDAVKKETTSTDVIPRGSRNNAARSRQVGSRTRNTLTGLDPDGLQKIRTALKDSIAVHPGRREFPQFVRSSGPD